FGFSHETARKPSPVRGIQMEDYYPDHDGGNFAPIEAATVATWKAPAFLENLAVDADGAVFVTVYSHKRVDRYDPATSATTTFAEVPAPPMGLAFPTCFVQKRLRTSSRRK